MVPNLEKSPISYIQSAKKEFIAAFLRIVMKNNVVLKIHGFKQESDKIVRDGL